MKVFLSWSGDRSRHVAKALREWLPSVIQALEPWMSKLDIEAGSRWSGEIQGELEVTDFGIVCVTRDNVVAPWLLFEAGALSKKVEDSRVVPYLIDLAPGDLPAGPLSQFQAKPAKKSGTLDLLVALNSALGNGGLPEEGLSKAFEVWWPQLEKEIQAIPAATEPRPERSNDDKVDEILLLLRDQAQSKPRRRGLPVEIPGPVAMATTLVRNLFHGPLGDPGIDVSSISDIEEQLRLVHNLDEEDAKRAVLAAIRSLG